MLHPMPKTVRLYFCLKSRLTSSSKRNWCFLSISRILITFSIDFVIRYHYFIKSFVMQLHKIDLLRRIILDTTMTIPAVIADATI